jgi:hypothetical protein
MCCSTFLLRSSKLAIFSFCDVYFLGFLMRSLFNSSDYVASYKMITERMWKGVVVA